MGEPSTLTFFKDLHGRIVELEATLAREREAREKAETELAEHVRWAEMYGEPEEWVKRAQAAHGRAEDAAETLDRERAARAQLEAAVERIAAPKRPDGTYNLSREACEQIALTALHASRGDECATCEGVGIVEKMGPAGVPHTHPCPACSGDEKA